MGKFAEMIILNSIVLMLFYFFGLIEENTFIGFLLNPGSIWDNLWAAAGIMAAALVVGGMFAKGFNYFNNELAATTALLTTNGSIITLVIISFMPVYQVVLSALGIVFASLVLAPIIAYESFIMFEWWRGRDQ